MARLRRWRKRRPGSESPTWLWALGTPLVLALAGLSAGSCDSDDSPAPVPDAGSSGCTLDEDCPLGQICSIGKCVDGCRPENDHCPPGEVCVGGKCKPELDSGADAADADSDSGHDGGPIECPEGMVNIDEQYCIDPYEASRPDATETTYGVDESEATSRPGVLPWAITDVATASYACAAVGKRLCKPSEFELACSGPEGLTYGYGDEYDPEICNGIDTFCFCGNPLCADVDPCPYPHCFDDPPPGKKLPPAGCGSNHHLMPTASFPDCHSSYGVYDINGNMWELTDDGSPEGLYRGGAYNCINSEVLHRCDYGTKNAYAQGFRCCWSP